ncbi:MAG: 16S rRNA (cytidine(1402)-2'-O)-methyltransferase [candidate division Zixibacteria bacterium]|nr:16S rRNA (cytidine(1402)-2'-O)-methyltransferase [candidate division Zixibacteria bacterium]
MTSIPGTIFLVPTPIGNMGDITSRAIEVLSTVEMIACEDTRVSGNLVKKLGISRKLVSYHEFNERQRAEQLVESVRNGMNIAVVTDGGSPGISDPAYRIVRAAIDSGLNVVALPGPCAIIPALTASGLPTDRFFFEGFLPPKEVARKKRLRQLSGYPHTLVFYESPHRVHKTLADALDVLGDREACLAREITKKFEQYVRGPISGIITELSGRNVKGEIVLVIGGAPKDRSEADND